MKRPWIVLAGAIALQWGAAAAVASAPVPDSLAGPTIHFVKGVVITHTVADAVNAVNAVNGDGESISKLTESTADSNLWASHYIVIDPSTKIAREIKHSLQVFRKDQTSARRMICWYMPSDPQQFPGYTSCDLSTDQFKELKERGSVAVNVGWINPQSSFGIGGELGRLMQTRKHYRGVLKIVEPKPVMLSVLVNGKPRDIPTIHISGALTIGDEGGAAEFWVQDDPAEPLFVKDSFLGTTVQLTRVDLRSDASDDLTLEQDLEKQCRANVPGIYFPTNSAELLSPSNTELDGLAAALQRHPQWTLSVEGHTDNIGKDSANADLSARRAGAVRAALVARGVPAGRIGSEGFGAKRPVAANATVAGRAQNRRVELRRDCKATSAS